MISEVVDNKSSGHTFPGRDYSRRAHCVGVGLIEVLIAILVMGIGLLGIAAMQATALRNSQSSLERSQAVIHSYGILDAMRANLPVARGGGYNTTGFLCDPPAVVTTLVTADQARWITAIEASMGENACGRIECLPIVNSQSRSCTVTVRWNDARATEGADEQEIETVSRL